MTVENIGYWDCETLEDYQLHEKFLVFAEFIHRTKTCLMNDLHT